MSLGTPTTPTAMVGVNSGMTVTSALFTPTANSLLFAGLASRRSSTLAASTVEDSFGLTWILLTDSSQDFGSGTRARQRVYVAATPAIPEPLQVTHRNAAAIRMALHLIEVSGTVSIPTNFIAGYDGDGDPSCVLPLAPAATSTLVGLYCATAVVEELATQPAGFTELEDIFSSGAAYQMETCYDVGGGATTNAWSSASTGETFATIVEVRAPSLARTTAVWIS